MGVDPPDAVAGEVGHHRAAVPVQRNIRQRPGRGRRAEAVGARAGEVAGERADRAVRAKPTDAIIASVHHNDDASGVHGNVNGIPEHGDMCWPVLEPRTGAGYRGHVAVGRDAADAVVFCVSHQDVAITVNREAAWVPEASAVSRAVGEVGVAATSQQADAAIGRDPADATVSPLADKHVSVSAHGHAPCTVEARTGCRPVLIADKLGTPR
mmetsp:Transcript_90460/g.292803  ORF Transcript_90460/g.292803 Transcript_90460/m.292803 type:complete len:211 (+) Transcript_90460:713-1345(+)